MTTATGQRIVAEFEFPSGAFSRMSFSFMKHWDPGGYALFQVTNGGTFFEIGNPDGVLHDNVASLVETQLTNLPIIATAKVTITGEKWRIEVTEAPGDYHYVGLLPLYFNTITVLKPPGPDGYEGCGCDAYVTVPHRQSVVEPPANDGDGGALTNVDAGDDPDDLTPPEGDDADPPANDGDGGALTNVDAGDDPDRLTPPEGEGAAPPANDGEGGAPPADDGEGGAPPADDGEGGDADPPDTEQEKSILQRLIDQANTPPDDGGRSRLQELVTNGDAAGRLDAGDLSISGGVNLPASDDGAHRSSYHLYYDADGGSYFLRFDDDRTADLSISADAPQVDAALEGLNGITSAEVTGEPGDFTITLIADEPHVLQWGDLNLGGDGGLDYLMG